MEMPRSATLSRRALVEHQQRRQHEQDRDEEDHHARSGEEPELGHPLEIRGEECVEGCRCRDRGDEDRRKRGVHRGPERLFHLDARVPLVDVAPVDHHDEIDAETSEQRGEARGRRGELVVRKGCDAVRHEQRDPERNRGVEYRRETAESPEEDQQHADDRNHDVRDHVGLDQLRVVERDHVAAGVRDLRKRQIGMSPRELRRHDLLHLGALRDDLPREGDVLRRLFRLREDERDPVVPRQVIAGREIERRVSRRSFEPFQEDREQIERIVLDDVLERERLRRFEHGAIAGHRGANALVRERRGNLVDLVGAEEEHRPGKDRVDQIDRVRHLVGHVFGKRRARPREPRGVDVVGVVAHSPARGDVDHHDVVVDRPHLADDPLELLNRAVVLRNEIQDVRVELDPRHRGDREHARKRGQKEDALRVVDADRGDRVDDPFSHVGSGPRGPRASSGALSPRGM